MPKVYCDEESEDDFEIVEASESNPKPHLDRKGHTSTGRTETLDEDVQAQLVTIDHEVKSPSDVSICFAQTLIMSADPIRSSANSRTATLVCSTKGGQA